ncbi:MAG: bifunctional nuclease family protein [Deltaproteobacteria bacterium]|nr:bifunctional nuclease family protein [Deltaproteobacteria bacterium]
MGSILLFIVMVVSGAPDSAQKSKNSEFVESTVVDVVTTESPPGHHVVLLREKNGTKVLPVWVGPSEALAISLRLAKRAAPRPLTHDLLERMLGVLQASVVRVQIEDLKKDTFLGRVFLKHGKETLNLDARPSDSIALALGAAAPIFVHRRVMERAGLGERDIRAGRKGGAVAPSSGKAGSL